MDSQPPPSMPPALPAMGQFTIPILVGTLMNYLLVGALFVQVYLYFLAFPKDNIYHKLAVGFLVIAEVSQTVGDSRDTIRIFGSGWGNPEVLESVGWSWFTVPVMGSAIASVGQMFFAHRIYVLGLGKNMLIPALITTPFTSRQITAFQFGAGIWSGVLIYRAKIFSELQMHLEAPLVAWLGGMTLANLIIVAGTAYYVIKRREPYFSRLTLTGLSQILRVTVETGLLCTSFALVNLVLFVTYGGNNYHLGICIWLCKIYSNSILAILNSRGHIGNSASQRSTNIVFQSGRINEHLRYLPQAPIAGRRVHMAALMADGFTWRVLPATLGFPVKNKQEYLLHAVELGRIFAWLKVNVRNPLDVVQAGDTVVLHVDGEGALADGTSYSDEYYLPVRGREGV
ncbi:hypothetical protein B0H16DRAFT_1685475 [Mycena metata]|uniref:DUF6534 domain-containing protein n=1 Tax=Mycena metata TaxID=1033252 RepID=A0AAD7NQF7_9AGAR|nr:hypothetical protein B0H16DRAFT_1685475 [Mycena metata]